MKYKELKERFEAMFLDGDKVEDCGGAMLSAKDVYSWIEQELSKARKEALLSMLRALVDNYPEKIDKFYAGYNYAVSVASLSAINENTKTTNA